MAIHKIKIFSGRGSEYLAEKIAASFGTTLGQSEVLRFSDGEFQPCYNESIIINSSIRLSEGGNVDWMMNTVQPRIDSL